MRRRLYWCGELIIGADDLCLAVYIEERSNHMAQKVQTLFIDDIDGGEAEGTVQFGLDGISYEIDLNTKHAEALRKSLARYVAASRKISRSRRPSRTRRSSGPNGASNSEVRAWARSQGMEVKERGRIPAELVVKFKAATGA
jgi:nucleoid-associated protein Lsr2